MQKLEFDAAFDELVAEPLVGEGFVRRGKSLYLDDGVTQVAWIRGGGRLTSPGSIAHLACFRHAFLRDRDERVPKSAPSYPENYPWLLNGEFLRDSEPDIWVFDPFLHMHLPYGRYEYADLEEADVRSDLIQRRDGFLRYMAWAMTLEKAEAKSQIKPFTQEFWIARLWLEDYSLAGADH